MTKEIKSSTLTIKQSNLLILTTQNTDLKKFYYFLLSLGIFMKNNGKSLSPKDYEKLQNYVDWYSEWGQDRNVVYTPEERDVYQVKTREFKSFVATLQPRKNSSNSHIPPSQDLNREKNVKTDENNPDGDNPKGTEPGEKAEKKKRRRRLGGQPGHKGATYDPGYKVDEYVYHGPDPDIMTNPEDWELVDVKSRTELDILIQKKTIEHRVLTFKNIKTGQVVSGKFPENIKAHLQYGTEIKLLVCSLREQLHCSYEQMSELIKGQTGYSISPSTVVNLIKAIERSPVLDIHDKAAEKDILESPCVHADETSLSLNGKKDWVHVLVNLLFSLFRRHSIRGKEGMDAIGLIGQLNGTLVHDFWGSYNLFHNVEHSYCAAHLLRELNAAKEMNQNWAAELHQLLQCVIHRVNKKNGVLPEEEQKLVIKKYEEIIEKGYEETGGKILARPPDQANKRGRPAKSKPRNLLERLDKSKDGVLSFIRDINIPATNNSAERPIRMMKRHQATSGCFRSTEHENGFLRVRSFIDSSRKHKIKPYQACKMLAYNQTPDYIKERLAETPTKTKKKKTV